jgi:AcrR family transcriptional regulator
MLTPLEKARRDPESMKARILSAGRRIFGAYGFHGTTTRLIAQEVGIDISTLHYHWGDKKDLYEAVIFDITEDLRQQLRRIETVIHGRPLAERMEIAIDAMTDYQFERPEIANLTIFRYFGQTRTEMEWDRRVPDLISDVARSMGMQQPNGAVSARSNMRVLAMMNAIHNFISGESFFRSMLHVEKEEYVSLVKETLKFILIPAFAHGGGEPGMLKG